jgi:hypothetical protein
VWRVPEIVNFRWDHTSGETKGDQDATPERIAS